MILGVVKPGQEYSGFMPISWGFWSRRWSGSGPEGGPEAGPEAGNRLRKLVPGPDTVLPCPAPYYTLPRYTSLPHPGTPPRPQHAARRSARRPVCSQREGRVLWAQEVFLAWVRVSLLRKLPRVVTVLREEPTGVKAAGRQEQVKDWIEQGESEPYTRLGRNNGEKA